MTKAPSSPTSQKLKQAESCSQSDPDRCLSLCEEILDGVPEETYGSDELQALFLQARSHWLTGNQESSILIGERLLKLARDPAHSLYKAKAYNILGNVYFDLENHEEALQHYLKGLSIVESLGAPVQIHAALLNNIGEIHNRGGAYEKALTSYRAAHAIAGRFEARNLMGIIGLNMGEVRSKMGDFEDASRLIQDAIDTFKETGDLFSMSQAFYILGNARVSKGLFQSAEEAYLKSRDLCRERTQDENTLLKVLNRLSRLYMDLNRTSEALECLESVFSLAEGDSGQRCLSEAFLTLAVLREKDGDYHRALEAYKRYHATQVHLDEESLRRYRRSIEIQFNIRQAEIEREILRSKNLELEEKNRELEDLSGKLTRMKDRFRDLSLKDSLTGIPNRRFFYSLLVHELNHAKRDRSPLTLVILDIDYFKQYNDHYGHLEGDRCLVEVVRLLLDTLRRKVDLLARYGGDEFVLLLPRTDCTGARVLLEAMVGALRQRAFPHDASPGAKIVTLTAGGICLPPTIEKSPDQLFRAADEVLYAAKSRGRNTFLVEEAR